MMPSISTLWSDSMSIYLSGPGMSNWNPQHDQGQGVMTTQKQEAELSLPTTNARIREDRESRGLHERTAVLSVVIMIQRWPGPDALSMLPPVGEAGKEWKVEMQV